MGRIHRPRDVAGHPSRRPRLTVPGLCLLLALFLVAVDNRPFWAEMLRVAPPNGARGWLFLAASAAVLTVVLAAALSWVAFGVASKPLFTVLLLVTALATYFTNELGTMIDGPMVRNVLETDWREAGELVNVRMLLYVALLGILPAALVWSSRLRSRGWRRELGSRLALSGTGLVLLSLFALFFYPDAASVARNHRYLRDVLTPVNYLHGTLKVVGEMVEGSEHPTLEAIGTDAVHVQSPGDRQRVVILVVGETARAREFSLNGYGRVTNPELALEPVVSFTRMQACGTATATSLPCLFSRQGRATFDVEESRRQEGLLDVLSHAGIRVLWRDNNSGCKGVCDRVEAEGPEQFAEPALCEGEECFDETLLSGLEDRLLSDPRDTLIVLHQLGSHGPAYDRRYPDAFRVFTPVCASADLQACERREIVNAYDNTIRYTDHLLASLIRLLEGLGDRVETALVYVSDHGESLGENNLYLHGLPYWIAPDEQTRVPFILWLSPAIERSTGIARSCLQAHRADPLTHEEIFHSILGLMDVATREYEPRLDLFAACRDPATRGVGNGLVAASPGPPPPAPASVAGS